MHPGLADLPALIAGKTSGYKACLITDGQSGATVHRFDAVGQPGLFLKHGTGRIADDIADEYARLRWLNQRLAAPPVIAYVEDETGCWLLTGALAGQAAEDWLEANPGRHAHAMASIAAFLRTLHAIPAATCPFNAQIAVRLGEAEENVRLGRIDLDDLDPERAGWSAQMLWAELQRRLPFEADLVVTHGDYSFDNIFLDDDGTVTGCLDVGRVGVADRWQDLAILWHSWRDVDSAHAAEVFRHYDITPDESRITLHLLFDEFF